MFKKKKDPIAERAAALNQQIAALEAQIQQLAGQQQAVSSPPPATSPAPTRPASPFAPRPAQPRLRSTAKPQGPAVPAASPPPPRAQEPIFEEVDHERLQQQQEQATSEQFDGLGVRQNDFSSVWRRLKTHFRGPATNNPKLVNYLAAGSIQGLRPMRYEKRVARNRFIVLVVVLALALWGLIAIFLSKR